MEIKEYIKKFGQIKEKDLEIMKKYYDPSCAYDFTFGALRNANLVGNSDRNDFEKRVNTKIRKNTKLINPVNSNQKESITIRTDKVLLNRNLEKIPKNCNFIDGYINVGDKNNPEMLYVRCYSYYDIKDNKTKYDIMNVEYENNKFFSSRARAYGCYSSISYENLCKIEESFFNKLNKLFENEMLKCKDMKNEEQVELVK